MKKWTMVRLQTQKWEYIKKEVRSVGLSSTALLHLILHQHFTGDDVVGAVDNKKKRSSNSRMKIYLYNNIDISFEWVLFPEGKERYDRFLLAGKRMRMDKVVEEYLSHVYKAETYTFNTVEEENEAQQAAEQLYHLETQFEDELQNNPKELCYE